MSAIAAGILDVRRLDELARASSFAHDLDSRVKLIVTLLFLAAIASFRAYETSALIPFFLFPFVMLSLGNVPARPILKRLAFAAPFAVCMGAFNPLLDRAPLLSIGGFSVSAGWVSYLSILLRFILAVSSVLLLIAVTGMDHVAAALRKLGFPRPLVNQLLLMYRYLFLLSDEAERMIRSRALRAFGRPLGLGQFGYLTGTLLLRTLDRGRRIHAAMASRGFHGEIRMFSGSRLRAADFVFAGGWIGYFALCRATNVAHWIGALAFGAMQ